MSYFRNWLDSSRFYQPLALGLGVWMSVFQQRRTFSLPWNHLTFWFVPSVLCSFILAMPLSTARAETFQIQGLCLQHGLPCSQHISSSLHPHHNGTHAMSAKKESLVVAHRSSFREEQPVSPYLILNFTHSLVLFLLEVGITSFIRFILFHSINC